MFTLYYIICQGIYSGQGYWLEMNDSGIAVRWIALL
jgi:hypothetical protein